MNTFIESEKRNYSLFGYVNELTNESEVLDKQINQLERQLKQAMEKEKQKGSRNKILQEMEDKLHKSEQKAGQYD